MPLGNENIEDRKGLFKVKGTEHIWGKRQEPNLEKKWVIKWNSWLKLKLWRTDKEHDAVCLSHKLGSPITFKWAVQVTNTNKGIQDQIWLQLASGNLHWTGGKKARDLQFMLNSPVYQKGSFMQSWWYTQEVIYHLLSIFYTTALAFSPTSRLFCLPLTPALSNSLPWATALEWLLNFAWQKMQFQALCPLGNNHKCSSEVQTATTVWKNKKSSTITRAHMISVGITEWQISRAKMNSAKR